MTFSDEAVTAKPFRDALDEASSAAANSMEIETTLADDRDDLLPHRLVLDADLPGRMTVALQPAWRSGYAEALRLSPSAGRPSAKLLSFDTALGAMPHFPAHGVMCKACVNVAHYVKSLI